MPRRPRVVIPGLPHHITQRGNNRENVFFSDQDRLVYIGMLREHSRRYDFQILGWCLMTNHIHLIAVPRDAKSLALTLGQTHAQYSLQLNRQESRIGHLWQNRFFSCPLEPAHLLACLRYVDLNPVSAGLVANAWGWPWSSARVHTDVRAGDALLDARWAQRIAEAHLGPWDCADWKATLAGGQPAEEAEQIRRATKVGEPLGSEAFVLGLEREAGRRLRVLNQGRPPRKQSAVIDGQQQMFA